MAVKETEDLGTIDENAPSLRHNISDILKESGCEIKMCDKNKNVVGDATPDMFGQQVERTQRFGAISKELSTYSAEEKYKWALMVKDKGNECYYRRQIKEATDFYVDCLIALDLQNEQYKEKMKKEIQLPVTTNLAACMLENGQNLRCAELANVALSIDDTNYVPWFRKAIAHFRLSDYEDALHDFTKAMELLGDTTNNQYQRMQMYVYKIKHFLQGERKAFRRAFTEFKIQELYSDKHDWKPQEKKEPLDVDDSDEAIARILEKYRPLTWTKCWQVTIEYLTNCILCRRRKVEKQE